MPKQAIRNEAGAVAISRTTGNQRLEFDRQFAKSISFAMLGSSIILVELHRFYRQRDGTTGECRLSSRLTRERTDS
jgi:hypothetical protein